MTNQQLFELYKRHKSVIYETSSRCDEDMEGPFLIAPSETYWSAQTKVVFVGQETNGWSSEDDISLQMATYTNFSLGKSYYSSPFWNVIRKFETALTGSHFSSAWLNFNRYDQEGGRPSWDNQCILSELDFLLLEEIKLLTPDVVIFFTGPNYDERITALMGSSFMSVNNFSIRQLSEIQATELKTIMFRTYHPNYLRRAGLEEKVIEEICTEVKTRMQRN